MTHSSILRGMALAVLLMGCAKDQAVEPLPLAGLTVYDVVPVRVVNVPATGGVAMLCKRSIDDPVLASAMLFDAAGSLTSRMDFGTLPSVVENITFGLGSSFITDLVPMADGTYLLVGLGRQSDIEDELYLLVYRVDAFGNPVVAPVRRYVGDNSVMVRADDTDELYRTTALGAMRAEDRLVVAVRYDRMEAGLAAAYYRTFQIGLTAGAGNYGGPSIRMADNSHQLRHVLADGQGGNYSLLDTTNSTGPGSHLLVKHIAWSGQTIEGIQEGTLRLPDAEPSSALLQNGALVIVGNYQVEADVRRPFFNRSPSLSDLDAGTVLPDIGGAERSAIIRALVPSSSGFTAVCNVYEQRVLSNRALRDDRFCDLTAVTLAGDGSLLDSREIVTGKGMRALGAWSEGAEWITGGFHPFLNTDYVHGFVVRTTP